MVTKIPITHRYTEAVFSTRSMRQVRDRIEELLGDVFSTRSVPRDYKQDKFGIF
jgi:hypothetical protein